jgi:hypothetical protein
VNDIDRPAVKLAAGLGVGCKAGDPTTGVDEFELDAGMLIVNLAAVDDPDVFGPSLSREVGVVDCELSHDLVIDAFFNLNLCKSSSNVVVFCCGGAEKGV